MKTNVTKKLIFFKKSEQDVTYNHSPELIIKFVVNKI